MLLEIDRKKQNRLQHLFKAVIEPYLDEPLDNDVVANYLAYWHGLTDERKWDGDVEDSSILYLQDDIVSKLKDEYKWLTGIGLIEAAEKMINTSFENGNLSPSYKEKEYEVA